jgi:hypothetical protein
MPQNNSIGMAVPGASSLMTGAPSLADQVAGETADQRRKRLQALTASKQLPVGMSSLADGYGSALSTS